MTPTLMRQWKRGGRGGKVYGGGGGGGDDCGGCKLALAWQQEGGLGMEETALAQNMGTIMNTKVWLLFCRP